MLYKSVPPACRHATPVHEQTGVTAPTAHSLLFLPGLVVNGWANWTRSAAVSPASGHLSQWRVILELTENIRFPSLPLNSRNFAAIP